MGRHIFFLEVTVSGKDIEAAAKKLKFIRDRKAVEEVSCSAAFNSQGNWYPPLERWPFKRYKKDNCYSKRQFDEAVKKEVEKICQKKKTKTTKKKRPIRLSFTTTTKPRATGSMKSKPKVKRKQKKKPGA